jgi:hypothetical protein
MKFGKAKSVHVEVGITALEASTCLSENDLSELEEGKVLSREPFGNVILSTQLPSRYPPFHPW